MHGNFQAKAFENQRATRYLEQCPTELVVRW
jgi:hypothetical protein